MNNIPFIHKYKPDKLDKLSYISFVKHLNRLQHFKLFRLLLIGESGIGKTTILSILESTLKEQYKILTFDNFLNNRSYIFDNKCNIILVIDNIDYICNKNQQLIKKYIDNDYINCIFTATNINKVIENVTMRTIVYSIDKPDIVYTQNLISDIIDAESIDIDKSLINVLIDEYNNSLGDIINYLEKLSMLSCKVTKEVLEDLSTNISNSLWQKYDKACISNDRQEVYNIIKIIENKGYAAIDILHNYMTYIKNNTLYDENLKYTIIKLIIEYINMYYCIEYTPLHIIFFSNSLIKIFNKYNVSNN